MFTLLQKPHLQNPKFSAADPTKPSTAAPWLVPVDTDSESLLDTL
jgi:hypothetical protein